MSVVLPDAEKRTIVEGLDSSDAEVRRLSAEQLVLLPVSEAVSHLAELLGDPVWRVRKAVVERLAHWSDHPPVHDMLVAALSDGENPGRRNSAIEALIACGPRVTERLVREITSADVDVRKLVIDALAAIGDPASRKPLAVAITDADANVRAAAAEALGVVGDVEEIPTLSRVANDAREETLVRLSALRALAHMEASVAVSQIGDCLDDPLLRAASFDLLGHAEDPLAVGVLAKGLSTDRRSSREAAMGSLLRRLGRLDGSEAEALCERLRSVSESDPRLVESACERLESADLATRMMLIQFLGALADARAVIPILQAGADEAVHELADATLERFGDRVAGAVEAAWDEQPFEVRLRACPVLGRVAGDTSEDLLIRALDAADSELRCAAATALGQGEFHRCLPDLVRRLEVSARVEELDAEDEVETLIAAIVRLAERAESTPAGFELQVLEVLSSRLAGAPEPVRLAIAQVLAHLGHEQHEEVIAYLLKDESPPVRQAAVQALARFDLERCREPLRLALADESAIVRMAAARVLGEIEDDEVAPILERLMHDEDPHVTAVALRSAGRFYRSRAEAWEEAYELLARGLAGAGIVALASLEALTEIGGEGAARRALAALERSEAEVLRAAIDCVGAHGPVDLLADLLGLLGHADWSVRAAVARVLSDRAYRRGLPSLLRRLELEDDLFVRETLLGAIRHLEE